MNVYVVIEAIGEYSDRREGPVAVYQDEQKAKTHVELAQRQAEEKERRRLRKRLAEGGEEAHRAKDDLVDLDHGRDTPNLRRYYYETAPLRDDIPQELKGEGEA